MTEKLTLAERCRIHANKMWDEGWYVTANVLDAAADELEENEKQKHDHRSIPSST